MPYHTSCQYLFFSEIINFKVNVNSNNNVNVNFNVNDNVNINVNINISSFFIYRLKLVAAAE